MRSSKRYAIILTAVAVVSVLTVSGAVAYNNHEKNLSKNSRSDIIADSIVSSEVTTYASPTDTTIGESLGSTLADGFTQPPNPENSETNAPNIEAPAQNAPVADGTPSSGQTSAPKAATQAQPATQPQTAAQLQPSETVASQATQPQVFAQPPATTAAQSSGNVSSSGQQSNKELVLEYTNQIRQAAGVGNLSLDSKLSEAADVRAQEIVQSFAHTRPDGTPFYTIAQSMGISYSTIGENIAYGYSSASSVVEGWKNSPGHYKNMVDTQFNKLGVGVYVQKGTYYWVQLFTN